jgi:hypothetical protein
MLAIMVAGRQRPPGDLRVTDPLSKAVGVLEPVPGGLEGLLHGHAEAAGGRGLDGQQSDDGGQIDSFHISILRFTSLTVPVFR